MEKMLLKSTTRHVRIFTAEVVEEELKFHPNKLTLDLDPDNEFIWNEDSLNKINEKFNELIKERAGKDLDDYELRKIGSCLLYTSPSPRDGLLSRMPSSA